MRMLINGQYLTQHKRAILIGKQFLQPDMTIRKVAEILGISKSTVHNDIYRLRTFDRDLYAEVMKVIDCNFVERARRGGEATRQKWLNARY